MRIKIKLFILSLFTVYFCIGQNNGNKKVLISTNLGDIIVELFNETPQHRDNFLKLVNEVFYDSLLFHRVINNFMIQGGDPDSKGAVTGTRLGKGGPGYQIPAEFVSKFYHKKGALAAARRSDQVNPEKMSSGSQFYIIVGTVFTPNQLDSFETKVNSSYKEKLLGSYIKGAEIEINALKSNNDIAGLNKKVAEIEAAVDSTFRAVPKFKFSDEMRKDYTTVGGYPSLDGSYTIFGQVIQGQDVVDKIASVEKDVYDRPVVDVIMKMKIIN